MASRPSDDAERIGSLSNVARAKNCFSAFWRNESYRAPTARAGGRFEDMRAGIIVSDAARDAPRFLRRPLRQPRRLPRPRQRVPQPRSRYAEVVRAARAFAARLAGAGLVKGDTVLFWSENRPEWIAALWGCLLQGIVAVPIDYRASEDLPAARRRDRGARVAAHRRRSPLRASRGRCRARGWPLAELDWQATATVPDAPVTRDDVGGDYLHVGSDGGAQGRRHHASQPAREHRAGRARGPQIPEIRTSVLSASGF